jgi:16S rRNA G966 N2-methylase RsmD
MSDCCQPAYDSIFDQSTAKKQLARYRKKGVKRSSRLMLKALEDLPLEGRLLDIGGGVGALSFELLQKGMHHTTHVDISQAYSKTFQEEIDRLEMEEQAQRIQGDFLDVHPLVNAVDLVVLDKVICCYENFAELIEHSTAKSQRWYACTIPRDKWWVKAVNGFGMWMQRLRNHPFRSYVHPVSEIERLIGKAGFSKVRERKSREWMTLVWERT